MLYVFLTSILILILAVLNLIYFIINNKKCSERLLKVLVIILVITLSTIAYCIDPKITNDLYRHFENIDIIRNYGFNAMHTYDNVLGAKILFYIISFFPNNHFLPAISAIITYGILMYIIYDFNKEKKITTRIIAISILLNFSMCTFSTAISGIRNAMAFAFLALGLYFDLIKKNKRLNRIWPYVIAVTIHPVSWTVIVIRILYNIKVIQKLKYIMLFMAFTIKYIVKLIKKINIADIKYVTDKLEYYIAANWIDDMRLLYVTLIMLIFIYILTILLKKKKEVKYINYIDFIQLYILVILGSVFIAKVFVKRLTLLMAFFIIPLIYMLEREMSKKGKIIVYGIFLIFIIGLTIYSVIEVKGNMGFIF